MAKEVKLVRLNHGALFGNDDYRDDVEVRLADLLNDGWTIVTSLARYQNETSVIPVRDTDE